jgi:hypothetical protein
MQCLGGHTEKPLSVRLVIVGGDQCGAPGAEGTIGKEFYTANSEALVETIVDETRYLGAPVVIRGGMSHQPVETMVDETRYLGAPVVIRDMTHRIEPDLSQSSPSVSTIYVIKDSRVDAPHQPSYVV